MQKSTKRLLSMLVVLALVLGFAPAGILAVETEAAAGDTNWTAAAANGGLTQTQVAEKQKAQTDAVAALRQLTGDTIEKRLVELKTLLPTCPFCGKSANWMAVTNGGTPMYGSTSTTPQHHYAYGTISKTGALAWYMSQPDSKACVLLDEGAVVTVKGRVQLGVSGNKVNIGGLGTLRSDMSGLAVGDSGANKECGMFNLGGANTELNLYGGTYINDCDATKLTGYTGFNRPLIFVANSTATVNIWTNDVKVGPENVATSAKMNVRISSGTVNLYGGTIRNAYANTTNHGWNVMLTGGTFNMYGGTVTGGTGLSTTRGGNVHNRSNFNMYGGTISSGRAQNGGNVAVHQGTFNMHGGEIKNGVATINGGNVWVAGSYTANLKGGVISGGDAASNGGNIFVNGTANLEDVDVQNGNAIYGGNISVVSGKLTMTADTSVTGGANDNTGNYSTFGGNIFLRNSQDGTLLKGAISGGRAMNGGNVYVTAGSKAEINATISEGVARFGANVYITTLYSDNGTPDNTDDDRNWVNAVAVSMSGGSTSGGQLDALGAVVEPYGKDVYIGIGAQGQGSNVTLKNGFEAEQIVFTVSEGKNYLTIDSTWNGSAALYSDPSRYLGDPIVGGVATGELQGTLSNVNGSLVDVVYDGNGGLKLPAYQVVGTDFNQGYTDADEAVDAADGDITKKLVAAGDIELAGETVVIDPIKAINVTGTGTVKGMDMSNDDFAGHSGSITATGVTVEKDVTYNGNRYIALTGGDNGTAYTFHRLQVKLTNVTINPDKAGLYYKAEYKFDDIVAERAEAYGVYVALNQAATAESENFTSANVADATIENHTLASSSHGVYGIFKTTREPAANIAASKSVINGNPYITINWNGVDSEKYMGENVAKSLESAIQLADEKWDQITAKEDLTTWVNHWNDLGAFDANFIAALENITIS